MDTPFFIQVEDSVLADLHQRLGNTRWPDSIGKPWTYGTDVGELKSLVDYWLAAYDWRREEAALNALDHRLITIRGRETHFIHAKSPRADALPLLMTHGWPGSIVEFQKIIPLLTHPELAGGQASEAFHVICPSIPGYGFSEAPSEPGFDQREVAIDHIELMRQLGYERYGLQGGDWGSAISSWHARLAPDQIVGLHLNLIFAPRPKDNPDPLAGLSDDELARLNASRLKMVDGVGYQAIQGSKPQTLGYGLNDSPAGLLAWILEKFHGWTHHQGDLWQIVSKDEVLTNVMLYWLNQNITASTRLYYESAHVQSNLFEEGRIEVPTGHAVFPGELYLPPRAWVERLYNVTHWSIQDRGGHFAALEAPEALAQDLRTFFANYR